MDIYLSKEKALKYLGYKGQDIASISNTLEEVIEEVLKISQIKYIIDYQEITLQEENLIVLKNGLELKGSAISKRLQNCNKVAIIIATIGCEYDKKLLSLQNTDALKAALFDGAGSALVEEVMNKLNNKIKTVHIDKQITKRFSAGFGDLPLETNKAMINIYNATRRLGIVINENLLMTPSKSVTAIVGIRGAK